MLQKILLSYITPSLLFLNIIYPIDIQKYDYSETNYLEKNIPIIKNYMKTNQIIKENNIIFFGEYPDNSNNKILLELLMYHARNVNKKEKLFLALEMVSSDKQTILNQFNNYKINSKILLDKLDWVNNWKYLPNLYSYVFDIAKKNNIELIGIDIPNKSKDYKKADNGNLLRETWMAHEILKYYKIFPKSKIIVYTEHDLSKNYEIPLILNNLSNQKKKN